MSNDKVKSPLPTTFTVSPSQLVTGFVVRRLAVKLSNTINSSKGLPT